MSFGTFSAKYGAELKIPMDLHIDAQHPKPFGEEDFKAEEFLSIQDEKVLDAPSGQAAVINSVQDWVSKTDYASLPWSLIIPVAVIGVVAAGVGWYLTNGGKKVSLPI